MAERPPWEDSHTKLPFGAIAEDTIEVSLLHTSRGATTVARPLVDLGFDGYARRVGTLQVVPYQVKARRTLNPSKVLAYRVPVASVHQDPKAAILFAYFPAPGPQPFPRLFAIPVRISSLTVHASTLPRASTSRSTAGWPGRGEATGLSSSLNSGRSSSSGSTGFRAGRNRCLQRSGETTPGHR